MLSVKPKTNEDIEETGSIKDEVDSMLKQGYTIEPQRILFIGPSGYGKTYNMIHFLCQFKDLFPNSKVMLISKTRLMDKSWNMYHEACGYNSLVNRFASGYSEETRQAIDEFLEDETPIKILVCDDPGDEYLIKRAQKYNPIKQIGNTARQGSTWYMGLYQTPDQVPLSLRDNRQSVAIWKPRTKKNKKMIIDTYLGDLDEKDADKLMAKVFKNKHDFLWVQETEYGPRYYKNWLPLSGKEPEEIMTENMYNQRFNKKD